MIIKKKEPNERQSEATDCGDGFNNKIELEGRRKICGIIKLYVFGRNGRFCELDENGFL